MILSRNIVIVEVGPEFPCFLDKVRGSAYELDSYYVIPSAGKILLRLWVEVFSVNIYG